MNSMVIGQKLKELRGKQSVAAVAKDLRISTSALFMYERGNRIPRDEIKKRIAMYYGKTVDDIFFSC